MEGLKESMIPSYLYSSKFKTGFSNDHLVSNKGNSSKSTSFLSSEMDPVEKRGFVVAAPSEPGKIKMFSPAYYAACTIGGTLACGTTHTAVTPLDVVKCNMQIDPVKYKTISSGFGVLLKEQGLKGFYKGWAPTLLGYSVQDIALCPFEAVKVRVQTQPGFARGLSDGLPKIIKAEGVAGLYKGLTPLWGRQIPYTMMKFASFETIVEMMYKHAIPTPKEECSKNFQLGVSFAGGYVAGIFCAVVSHPADNLVSFLNNAQGATVGDAVKKLGLWGLATRGLPLRIVMIGTLTGVQWGIYDAFKVFVGLPTTGGTPPATAAK
uniref:mitochondrial phosphate carrier protein 3, mitochondrial-like isoform X2 n=1 Tax=Erigeron canadensis TaxID=72917 RepID=UPI001CB89F68|nr:mitochondrial phosphate carrier protein 3, mitochondrial-like isoform X2 [Erigeron canadensis]